MLIFLIVFLKTITKQPKILFTSMSQYRSFPLQVSTNSISLGIALRFQRSKEYYTSLSLNWESFLIKL